VQNAVPNECKVHCLVDVPGSRFNIETVEAMKNLASHNRPFASEDATPIDIGSPHCSQIHAAGSYRQNGSLSNASPVYAYARAREPPHIARYLHRPHLPLNSFGLCRLRNSGALR